MSRSRRETPIFRHTSATSDHQWKKKAARKLRRAVKQNLCSTLDGDRLVGKRWELVDPWTSDKDGKFYWVKVPDKHMRK